MWDQAIYREIDREMVIEILGEKYNTTSFFEITMNWLIQGN